MKRCFWVDEKSEIYVKYHDEEWGVPKYDDKELFELLILESFQAGLSWITILKKRENFRKAFDNFDIEKIINYLWNFTDNKIIKNTTGELITSSPLSDKISKDLKKRGMKFVGTVIIYSYLQAAGVVADHDKDCYKY